MNTSSFRGKVGRFFSARTLGWAGLAGVAGCTAACALPLLAAAGVGGGASAALARHVRPGAELITGGLAFAGVLGLAAVWRRWSKRKAHARDPGSPGCGCGSAGGGGSAQIFRTPPARQDEPVACTADLKNTAMVQAGMDGYRAAFQRLVATERFPGGFRWRFRSEPGLDAELTRLAEGEHRCCRFLAFDIATDGPHIVWEVRAHEQAAAFLEEYALLPQRLSAEPRPGHDIRALKNLAAKAGLVLTSEGEGGG